MLVDLEVARLQPALDEARGGPQAVQRRRVIGDQPLGEDAFVHPAQAIERAAGRVREVGWRHGGPHRVVRGHRLHRGAHRARARGRSASARCSRPATARASRALADELGGLESAVADVARPETRPGARRSAATSWSPASARSRAGARRRVEAAIDAGAHYLDSTGETPFIRRIFEQWGPRAEAAGVALLTAMGYDWVPGNLAGALALRPTPAEAADARRRSATSCTGRRLGMSGGTRASAAGVFLEPSFAWRGGRIVTERGGAARAVVPGRRPRRARRSRSAPRSTSRCRRRFPGCRRSTSTSAGSVARRTRCAAVSLGLSVATRLPLVRGVLGEVHRPRRQGQHRRPGRRGARRLGLS